MDRWGCLWFLVTLLTIHCRANSISRIDGEEEEWRTKKLEKLLGADYKSKFFPMRSPNINQPADASTDPEESIEPESLPHAPSGRFHDIELLGAKPMKKVGSNRDDSSPEGGSTHAVTNDNADVIANDLRAANDKLMFGNLRRDTNHVMVMANHKPRQLPRDFKVTTFSGGANGKRMDGAYDTKRVNRQLHSVQENINAMAPPTWEYQPDIIDYRKEQVTEFNVMINKVEVADEDADMPRHRMVYFKQREIVY